MIKYSAKRLLQSVITLLIIVTVVFSLMRLMPVEGYFQNFEKMDKNQINTTETTTPKAKDSIKTKATVAKK